jgi:hypothetical protein
MATDDPRIPDDDAEERGRPISGERLMERYGIPHRGSLPRRRGPRGPGGGSRSGSSDGAAPPSESPRRLRGGPIAAALLAAAVVVVIVAVALPMSGGDDTATKTPAPAAKPAFVAHPLTMDFRQLRHGLPGKATISIALFGHGSAHMTIKAAVPNAQYEVSLIKAKGSSKRLLLARDGETTYTNDINLATLARRYVAIEVLALPLPHRPGHGRVRSLRLNTLQLTERLLRNAP